MPIVGTRIKITANFSAGGVAIDPIAVKLTTRVTGARGNSSEVVRIYGVAPDLIRASVGVYYLSLLTTVAGLVQYRWESTGPGQESVIEGSVTVTGAGF